MDAPKTAIEIAKLTLPMMARHNIDPTPANYAVWYGYVEGKNPDLLREIDKIIHEGVQFTNDMNLFLYHRYMAEEKTGAADAVQAGAQNALSQVLRVLSDVKGETANHGKEVERYIDNLTNKADDASVETIVKEILASAITLKASSDRLNKSLEESQAEIGVLKENLVKVSGEAHRDFLTGVANRKAFERALEEQMKVSEDNKTDLCLLMLDIDHFKSFNDKFGHLIGDEVLKIVAKSLTDSVRGKDTVARYGGEEFAVILPLTPVGGAMIVAESIRKAIASRDLKRKGTGESYGVITVSVGVSLYRPGHDNIPLLIKRADDALYRSKKAGRNRVTQETLN